MSYFHSKPWKPHDYQNDGSNWLLMHLEGALFWKPGLGKTTTVLNAYCKLKDMGYDFRMLVIAPLRVAENTWMTEYKKWSQFSELRIGLAHGPDKLKILKDYNYDIVVINYDVIQWLCQYIDLLDFQIVVFDEITRLKHTNTKRFKALKPHLGNFKIRWGLTGTPAANGLMDLFGQVYCLDLGQRFSPYITHFRTHYFYQKRYEQYNWYITKEKEQELYKKLEDLAHYLNADDILKLPPLITTELKVDLPPKVKEQYFLMERYAIMQLEDTTLTAINAGVVIGKLRQIASGAVYTDNEHNYTILHSAKIEALCDLVEELAGDPLIVAYSYHHEIDCILKEFPHAAVIRGGTRNSAEIIDAWNAGFVPLLCVQTSAAAYGLNLQFGGANLCWFSETYNLEDHIQLIARLHRQGQLNTVNMYKIIARGTVDEEINKVLDQKHETQEALFAALQEQLLKKNSLQLVTL